MPDSGSQDQTACGHGPCRDLTRAETGGRTQASLAVQRPDGSLGLLPPSLFSCQRLGAKRGKLPPVSTAAARLSSCRSRPQGFGGRHGARARRAVSRRPVASSAPNRCSGTGCQADVQDDLAKAASCCHALCGPGPARQSGKTAAVGICKCGATVAVFSCLNPSIPARRSARSCRRHRLAQSLRVAGRWPTQPGTAACSV